MQCTPHNLEHGQLWNIIISNMPERMTLSKFDWITSCIPNQSAQTRRVFTLARIPSRRTILIKEFRVKASKIKRTISLK